MRRTSRRFLAALLLSFLVVGPSPASANSDSIWNLIEQYSGNLKRLVLLSGYASVLDYCSNGAPQYTAFVPVDNFLAAYLQDNRLTIAALSGSSGLAEQFVADHVVNGDVSPDQLLNPAVPSLLTWSGRTVVKSFTNAAATPEIGANVLMMGRFVIHYARACNGIVYFLHGEIGDAAAARLASRAAINGTNSQGAPQGAQRPERPVGYLEFEGEPLMLPDTL